MQGGWGRRDFGRGRRFFREFPEDIPTRPLHGFPPFRESSEDEEKRFLESLVEDLERELKEIRERLGELSKKQDE
jgi:hypothetical protein